MQEYQGQPCPVCGEAFAEQDDIVTCPDCGTPYHRACWKQTGHCINTALHESGESWIIQRRKEMEENGETQEADAQSADDAAFDPDADEMQRIVIDPEDPCIGMDPEEVLDGAKLREVAEFVQTSRFYYLPLFRIMKRTGKKLSFNLLCLLCPQYYFANRKMWGLALASMLIKTVLYLPITIMLLDQNSGITIPWADVGTESFQALYHGSFIALALVSVFWSFLANYLYYRFTIRRISGIKKTVGTEEEMYREIKRSGGTSMMNVFLMLVMQFVLTRAAAMLLMLWR
ncbi:MAG TPA: hypothetical protein DCG49_00270 [Ruminococcus sp.]|nr:hypothetical protein [Ruminococcus sp.]